MAFKDFTKFTRNSVGNLFLIDTLEYDMASIHMRGTWAGTITFEGTNDTTNATWVAVPGISAASVGSSQGVTSTTGTNSILVFPTRYRYLRGRISTYTSGTFEADVFLSTGDAPEIGFPVWLQNSPPAPTAQSGSTTFVKTTAAVLMVNLKTSAGNVMGAYLRNNAAADRYVRFYNKASAPVSTDVPVCVFRLPAGADLSFDHELAIPRFTTGISMGITAGAADNDATVNAVNDVSGWVVYA